uniref:BSD domain-containing protein n=1 Tax=Toxocara canis TaxID=6265 RepID=A0A183U8W2_TOXCA
LRSGSTRNADAGRQPLSAVGLLSGPGPAGAQPHRGVILTAEQRDQLQQLRNQLTESDLMNWSEYFRRLAFERARNRAMAQALNAQQQVQAHMRGIVPAAIREEEEEIVMDPFSNADNDNNGSPDEGGGGASADIDPSIHHEDSNAS